LPLIYLHRRDGRLSCNKHYSGHHWATEIEGDQKHLEKRSPERNVESRIQVQLEEDGGGSTRQSWPAFTGSEKAMKSSQIPALKS